VLCAPARRLAALSGIAGGGVTEKCHQDFSAAAAQRSSRPHAGRRSAGWRYTHYHAK
jgi:hypothetical protein